MVSVDGRRLILSSVVKGEGIRQDFLSGTKWGVSLEVKRLKSHISFDFEYL